MVRLFGPPCKQHLADIYKAVLWPKAVWQWFLTVYTHKTPNRASNLFRQLVQPCVCWQTEVRNHISCNCARQRYGSILCGEIKANSLYVHVFTTMRRRPCMMAYRNDVAKLIVDNENA